MVTEKTYVRNETCSNCGCAGGVGVWMDEKGKEQSYCFRCGDVKFERKDETRKSKPKPKVHYPPNPSRYQTIQHRSLLTDTCVKYQVASHGPIVYFPSAWDGKVQGFKCRDFNFEKADKLCHMSIYGDYTSHFFGWQAVHTKNIIAIAFGEFDAMAVYQATGIPCLSPPAGDGSLMKCLKSDFARLEGFEKIVILPDRDNPESIAKQPSDYVKEAVEFLGEDRCHVATMAFDDPNEYIMQGHTALLKQTFYAAESKAMELFIEKPSALISPSQVGILTGTPLDRSLQGLRSNEVTYLLGAPGSGKTTLAQNLSYSVMQSNVKVCALVLEGKHSKFIGGLANVIAGGNYHSADPALQEITREMIDSQLKVSKLTRKEASIEGISRAVRAAVKVADCKLIVVDNLSGAANPEKLFETASALVLALDDLALDLDCHILVIAHIGRQSYQEPPSLGSGFGSGHIEKFAYNVVGVHRKDRLTRIEVLKNREFGPTPYDVFYGELQDGKFRYFNKQHQPTESVNSVNRMFGG